MNTIKKANSLLFVGYEAHSMEHGDHVALNYDLDAPLVECTSIEDWKQKAKGHKVFITPHHMGYQEAIAVTTGNALPKEIRLLS